MKAGTRNIEITNENKLIFPGSGVSKKDIAEYYNDVADLMLPYLRDRPLMLQRFPNGITQSGFYQKEAADYFPGWIKTITVPKEGGEVNHVLCNNAASLIYLVNQGTVSFHTWLSKAMAINYPDRMIIDIDPASNDFNEVRHAATIVKAFVDELSIRSFVMATGSSGVHIVIPLDGRSTFDESRETAGLLAKIIMERDSDTFTMEQYKKNRQGKIYFDIQRNAYAQTGITPFSLRPLPGAPVATPISWEELEEASFTSQTFTIHNMKQRLARMGDPWKGMGRYAISINSLSEKLNKYTHNLKLQIDEI